MARLTKGQTAQLREILMVIEFADIAMKKGELEVCRRNIRAALKRFPAFMGMHAYVDRKAITNIEGKD